MRQKTESMQLTKPITKKKKGGAMSKIKELPAALKMLRKGQKPVLDSKGKPVKNLTQKAGPGKPMTPEMKKKFKDALSKIKMPKRQKRPKDMTPLMGAAARGMSKGLGGKSMKAAAKKLKRSM